MTFCDTIPEEALKDELSQTTFVRRKTVKVPKKVKTYTPYEVESWAEVHAHEKTSFGINVDDFIDLHRKKEERLNMKRTKIGKIAIAESAEAQ